MRAAIDGLRDMKAKIEAEVQRRDKHDDLKLGPGGIREIEFYVQALQIIYGGRHKELQVRSLLEGLMRLRDAGLIDPQAEVSRLEKRIGKTRDEIKRARTKLSNENFVRNAPADVVAQEQARVTDFERTLSSLEEQLDRVRQLL